VTLPFSDSIKYLTEKKLTPKKKVLTFQNICSDAFCHSKPALERDLKLMCQIWNQKKVFQSDEDNSKISDYCDTN